MPFQINPQAIKHGNHISNVDAQYCTICSDDVAHPLFDGCERAECPHVSDQSKWKIGDLVTTFPADRSMGPGEITAFHAGHKKGTIAIVHYIKYAGTDAPCYRPEWYDELQPWDEPKAPEVEAPNGWTLTFQALRAANRARMPWFKNATGETKHSGKDWTVSDWAVATAGESGELVEVLLLYSLMSMALGKAQNIIKKMRRHDFDAIAAKSEVSDELADVTIYLDMLADSLGIDLGEATIHKWNKKSEQLGIPLTLTETSVVRS